MKALKIGNECLRQLNEIDLKDKPNVLLIVNDTINVVWEAEGDDYDVPICHYICEGGYF